MVPVETVHLLLVPNSSLVCMPKENETEPNVWTPKRKRKKKGEKEKQKIQQIFALGAFNSIQPYYISYSYYMKNIHNIYEVCEIFTRYPRINIKKIHRYTPYTQNICIYMNIRLESEAPSISLTCFNPRQGTKNGNKSKMLA